MRDVSMRSGDVSLPGLLALPENGNALVLFAYGSGGSRREHRRGGRTR